MELDITIHEGTDRVDLFYSGVRYCFIAEKNGRVISVDFTEDGIKGFQPNSSASIEIAKWKATYDSHVKYSKRWLKKEPHYARHYQNIIDHNDVGEIKLYKFNLIKKEVEYFKKQRVKNG